MGPRLVIANRGEIARRILRAGRALGYTVGVISTPADAGSLIRREADAILEVDDFLAIPAVTEACVAWKAAFVHPGYGFLSENPAFALAVEEAGLVFVGPTPGNMRTLGSKEAAKALARTCGVPVLEALFSHELATLAPERWGPELAARGLQPPYLVKASGGGGGRGMRVVERLEDLPSAVHRASQEALASFQDGKVFVERYLRAPRHIEIQVFGDGLGHGITLDERECSLQRRHQKVLEEAPSAALDPAQREALSEAALALVKAARYRGAGTAEFLLDAAGAFHFLEMNTRLQVEHPVTEEVHGVDLVQAQLELAAGHWPAGLPAPGSPPSPPRGVALEARILAEDPRQGWLPTPGPLIVYREPSGEGIRVDSGVAQGDRINPQYDSMIAKLIVRGSDRTQAVARLSRALEDFIILGTPTNLPFLQAISRTPDFLAGRCSTDWIGQHLEALNAPLLPVQTQTLLASSTFREALSCAFQGLGPSLSGPAERFGAQRHPELSIGSALEAEACAIRPDPAPPWFTVESPRFRGRFAACRLGPSEHPGSSAMALALGGETLLLQDPLAGRGDRGAQPPRSLPQDSPASLPTGAIQAPMGGKVVEVRVAQGDGVELGQLLFVVESMKMQLEILAPKNGRVASLQVREGQILQGPETLAVVE